MKILDPFTDTHWDEKILAYGNATIFHTTAWSRVLSETYGFSNCHLAETAGGGGISFVLPCMEVRSFLTGPRGVSLPFTDFCEPLMAGGMSGESALDAIAALGRERGWKYFELRGGQRLLGDCHPTLQFFSHTLDLASSEDSILAGIKESKHRNIRKARREGVQVIIGVSAEMMESYYRINCLTRREHGLPPQSLAFFRNLHKYLIAQGLGCVALARVRDQVVAGAVYLHFGGNALYKYGASNRRFLSHRPNDLLMWEAIHWYRARGFRFLSFGRTELRHEGLRRFKMAWGAQERTSPYYRYDFSEGRFVRTALRVKGMPSVFRYLPLGVSRIIGSVFYRHVA